jgi:CheY-like chemotaxis protein/nitrogen-specific signal transduction histidine kinase
MRKRGASDADELERQLAAREAVQDDFLAHLSHELRTPLQAVIGWTEMLMEAQGRAARGEVHDLDALQRGLQVILRNAKLQARLIDDMTDVASLSRGQLQLTRVPLEIDGVVSAAVDSVASSAATKGVELRVALDTPDALVLADAQRMQQVITNLLANAVKFSPPAAVVDVRTLRRGGQVVIEVEDRGQGIEPELLPVLFDRFRQGRAGRGAGAGMGLGLAIAHGLVQLHGGQVFAFSSGAGALLSVCLPLAPLGSESQPPPARPPIDAMALAGTCVAVCDDEPDAVEAVCSTLTRAGAKVAAFTSPEALLASDVHAANVLVLDLGMDDLSGLDLLAQLRARGVRAPAIALTGYAFERDRARALDAGFQVHVGKPVHGHELLAAVTRALELPKP